MDWLEQAAKLNSEWLAVQKKMVDTYMSNGQADASQMTGQGMGSSQTAMDAFSQYSDFGKKMSQQYAQFMTPVKQKSLEDYVGEASQAFQENYQSAWDKSRSMWNQFGGDMPQEADATLDSVMGPQAWWNKLYDPAQFGGAKMPEMPQFDMQKFNMPDMSAFKMGEMPSFKVGDMPTFAGLTNYDKKLVTAVDEWQSLQKEIANYAYVVMSAWLEAHTKFQKELETVMKSEEGTKGWREVVDFWQKTADKALMEMHRSEDFLKAQKGLIEASAAYRLAEQTVADETNKALHIPTRSEIDDLHRKVYELSKELRNVKKDMRSMKEELESLKAAPPKKASARKAPAKRATTTRSNATKDSK
jgi:class III poly(R)-hydroxyalkanoic acid synthase PhaE subunit